AEAFREYLSAPRRYLPQGEGSLGVRLARAFQSAFQRGAKRAIAVGADTPHLPLEILDQALRVVVSGQVALGPARDGGYYLIGIPRDYPHLDAIFHGEQWGTSQVLERTRQALAATSLPWQELEEFWDIDHLRDLVQWRQEIRRSGVPHPAPIRSLQLLEGLP
ncbi:MAG: TIGR04282 family arsenosugar biosynthesis glycosyltransferase, partial [Planctomycetota bacterium]